MHRIEKVNNDYVVTVSAHIKRNKVVTVTAVYTPDGTRSDKAEYMHALSMATELKEILIHNR